MFGKKEMRILMVGLDAAGKVPFQRIHTRPSMGAAQLNRFLTILLHSGILRLPSSTS
jgi:hypothetical protein